MKTILRLRLLGIVVLCLLLLPSCGGSDGGIDPGPTGYGAGAMQTQALDIRGDYLIDGNDIETNDCAELSSSASNLAGKKFYFKLLQDGDSIQQNLRPFDPNEKLDANAISKLKGTISESQAGKINATASKSFTQSKSVNGVNANMSIKVTMTMDATIANTTLTGTLAIGINYTVSAMGKSQTGSCTITTEIKGSRTQAP